MKNVARYFLLLLLLSVGAWWYAASLSDDYGYLEARAYFWGFIFVALLNIGNFIGDRISRGK